MCFNARGRDAEGIAFPTLPVIAIRSDLSKVPASARGPMRRFRSPRGSTGNQERWLIRSLAVKLQRSPFLQDNWADLTNSKQEAPVFRSPSFGDNPQFMNQLCRKTTEGSVIWHGDCFSSLTPLAYP